MKQYRRISAAIVSAVMLLTMTACASEKNEGHDYYYSSNVDPQFTPSEPLLTNRPNANHVGTNRVETDNIMLHQQQNKKVVKGKGMISNSRSDKELNNQQGRTVQSLSKTNNTSTIRNHNVYDLMMNGQAMNERQKEVMNKIRQVQGVNDATVIINNKRIIVGLDVTNPGRRDAVVNNVQKMLQQQYAGYEVQVTARKGSYDRLRTLNADNAQRIEDNSLTKNVGNRLNNLMDEFRELIQNIRETLTTPLR